MRTLFTRCLIILQAFFFTGLRAQNINTVMGGLGDGGPATAAEIGQPYGISLDKAGNIYIADDGNNVVRKVNTTGTITTYAGTAGSVGYTYIGDGGEAVFATLGSPVDVAADTLGNVFIADFNGVIRKVDSLGIISTYAGAVFSNLYGISLDQFGNLYVAETGYNQIEKISPAGTISTIAGNFAAGFSGDGFAATSANLNQPTGVCVDRQGNVFIADKANNRIRKVDTSGIITTIGGNGGVGFAGDGGLATAANLNQPTGICVDTAGNVYFTDFNNNTIRKITSSGIITTVAGTFSSGGFFGDGGPATLAKFHSPAGICVDNSGNLYIADYSNSRIRRVDPLGIITTVAGSSNSTGQGFKGDGGPANLALFYNPDGMCYDSSQNLYIADSRNNCIRKVNSAGIISTCAGINISGFSGDGHPADSAKLNDPLTVATDKKGNLFINDANNQRIRKVNSSGIISTYAGTGTTGYSGDGHEADSAKLNGPYGIACDNYGNLFITDKNNNRIRKVDTNQVITTIAGTGVTGYFGDGGAATSALLNQPGSIYIDDTGNIFFADFGNSRIRKIDPIGIITTIAGNGSTAHTGDGGPALSAGISQPSGITRDKSGNTYFFAGNYIRKINTSGIISSICGTGNAAFSGDGGPASLAQFNVAGVVSSIVIDTAGDLLFSDYSNNRVREVYNARVSINTPSDTICTGSGATFTATGSAGSAYTLSYHWLKNYLPVGADSTGYTSPVLHSGDVISCYVTNGPSGLINLATSNSITIITTPAVVPSLSITTMPGQPLCQGIVATVNSTPAHGGTAPVYNWYKNGSNVFTGNTYVFTPANNDAVYCKLTSNAFCTAPDTALSSVITFTVTPKSNPTVTVAVSPGDTLCSGANARCTATPTNGGTNPIYSWHKNSVFLGNENPINFAPADGDILYCWIQSNSTCLLADTAISAITTFKVNPTVIPAVSISINPGNTLCAGTPVECTPIGVNTGSTPVYNWYLNGVNVLTGNGYGFTPLNGDNLYCQLTSDELCASPQTVNSGTSAFSIDTMPSVTISIDPGQVVFRGTAVVFNAYLPASSIPVNYQWIKDGKPIPGATGASYTSANFSVWDSVFCVATAAGVCNGSSKSNTLYVDTYHGMKLYPNPNNGDFVINGNDYNANGDRVGISIYNSNGKVVYRGNAAFNTLSFYTEINLGHQLPAGVYFARLVYDLATVNLVFVVQ